LQWNDRVKQELTDYLMNPAVLVSAEGEPYEFRERAGSWNRLHARRPEGIIIGYHLFTLLLEGGIDQRDLMEFGSGLFLNWVSRNSIYA